MLQYYAPFEIFSTYGSSFLLTSGAPSELDKESGRDDVTYFILLHTSEVLSFTSLTPAGRVSNGLTQWLLWAVRPGDSPGAAGSACHRVQPARGCAEENICGTSSRLSHESQKLAEGQRLAVRATWPVRGHCWLSWATHGTTGCITPLLSSLTGH